MSNPEPWPSPGPLFDGVTWCDGCGEPLQPDAVHLESSPCDLASVDSGHPASVCSACHAGIVAMFGGSAP
jgi:hypothetical protein